MNFYTNKHPYYRGIDLRARLLYVCIIDDKNEVLVHKKIKDSPEQLLTLLTPYLGNIVVGVECMHCWYWVSDLCRQHAVDFVLGHALYMTNSSGMNLDSFSWPEGRSTGRTSPRHTWQ